MKRIIFVIVLLLCIVTLWFFVESRKFSVTDLSGYGLVFPNLMESINEVNEIIVSTGQDSFSVIQNDGTWQVKEHDYYPAQLSLVRNLLVGLSQTRKLEPKTSDPEKFAALGLDGTEVAESPTVRVMLYSQPNSLLGDLYIGNSRVSSRNAQLNEYFVRDPNEEQVWLVQSDLSIPRSSFQWLNTQILNLNRDRVRSVVVERNDSESIRVEKSSVSDRNYELQDIPSESTVSHQFRINSIGEVFKRLSFEDVQRLPQWDTRATVTVETFDGLTAVAQLGSGAFENYAVFSIQAQQFASEEVQQEASELMDRHRHWAYRLSNIRIETLEFQRDDLIE